MRSGYWGCEHCGYSRNCREDGPVCDNCGVDATAPVIGCAERPLPTVDLPVSREDFLPAGVAPDDPDDLPF